MLIVDTSGLIAYFDASDRHHAAVTSAFEADSGPFIVSPYVVAEVDYLLATRRGIDAEVAALAELAGGAWELSTMDANDVNRACRIIESYRDQDVGIADASLVVLAGRHRTNRILTLDRRHFDVLRTLSGKRFTVLPAR